MSQKMSRKALLAKADINVETIGTTYFPYPESCRQVAHAERLEGNNGVLLQGATSGCFYFSEPYANESGNMHRQLTEQFGNREKAIIENLVSIEVVETNNHDKSVFAFVARDNSRFTVATFDFGKTWTISG